MAESAPRAPRLWDRVFDAESVAYAAGIMGIAGTIAGAVLNIYILYRLSRATGDASLPLQLLIYLASFALILLLITTLLSLAYRRKLVKIKDQSISLEWLKGNLRFTTTLNQEISKSRKLVSYEHYYFCNYLHRYGASPRTVELEFQLQGYLDAVLDNTARLFTTYTGDSCAACVKVFCDAKDRQSPIDPELTKVPPQFVFTLRRDPASRQLRRAIDQTDECAVYRYRENAAFFYIIDHDQKPDWFVSNDLVAMGDDYWNANKDWASKYNATLVVPIKRPDKTARQQCVGFLCVDNLRGGFDDKRGVHILDGISVDLYYALRTSLTLLTKNGKEVTHG